MMEYVMKNAMKSSDNAIAARSISDMLTGIIITAG